MAVRRPRFYVQDPTTKVVTDPMAVIGGFVLSHSVPIRQRTGLRPQALLHQDRSYIDDQTAGQVTRIQIRFGVNRDDMTDVDQIATFLWDTIGTEKEHLWIADDDQSNTIDLTNAELLGSNVVCEYDGSQVSWLNVLDYLHIADGAGTREIVVVEAHAATPSFTADLISNHNAGTECHRLGVVYPLSVLTSIQSSPAPLGKTANFVMNWTSGEDPKFGTSLP